MRYVLEGMQRRDEYIEKVREEKEKMGARIDVLEKNNVNLEEAKQQLSSDLHKLLSHREEIEMMKNVLVGMVKDGNSKSSSSKKKKHSENLPFARENSKGAFSESKLNIDYSESSVHKFLYRN